MIERPPVVIERPARVIVERRYAPVPVYEDDDEPVYSYSYRPAFVGYDYRRYPRWRHFDHRHWRRW